MPKKNLLYVVTKLELGGAQKQVLGLIQNIDQEAYNIFLFTAKTGELASDFLSIDKLQIKLSRWLKRPINPLNDFVCFFELYNYIKRNKIDIVHTHSSKAGIIARIAAVLAGVKSIVHTVHGWSFNEFQPVLARKTYILLERFCAKFTDKLVVLSEYDLKKGLANGISSQTKYSLIRCGIEIDKFKGAYEPSLCQELGINNGAMVVGMIACLKVQKAPLDFIQAAKQLNKSFPEIYFVLVGDGVLRNQAKKAVIGRGLEDKFIFTGWRRDIPELLKIFDIFVLTSLWEGLPMVVLEAMASAVPVVVTDTGGISEIVQNNKTGFLVKPKDLKGIVEKVSILLKDHHLRQQFSQNSVLALSRDFDMRNIAQITQQLYREILTNN